MMVLGKNLIELHEGENLPREVSDLLSKENIVKEI